MPRFNGKTLALGLGLLHLLLVFLICSRDTLGALGQGFTIFPDSLTPFWRKAEKVSAAAVGDRLATNNPLRQALTGYAHSAGIQVGYGFFAPNVPSNYKIVFEVHYPGDRVEYELPQASNAADGLRLATLLDYIGQTQSDALRELLLKVLAYTIWREHPDATMIRAVLGLMSLPTPGDFEQHKERSYQFLYAYDFAFRSRQSERSMP